MKGKCILCNSDIERSPSGFNQYEKTFCSQKCMDLHTFKTRSKITNCIICKADLKPGEGWATPLKKRKDYLCPKCKQFGILRRQRARIKEIKKKLRAWYKEHILQIMPGICSVCGVAIVSGKKCKKCQNRMQTIKASSTPQGKINMRMRVSIGKALKGNKLNRKWAELVGYNAEKLKKHLEKLFLPGMGWHNYGKWHIDHIIPKSKFNYKNPEDPDFKRCWALNNLQPLWARDNLVKHDRLDSPMQPSLLLYSGTSA